MELLITLRYYYLRDNDYRNILSDKPLILTTEIFQNYYKTIYFTIFYHKISTNITYIRTRNYFL